MTVAEMEAHFFELKGKHAVGQLTDAEFKAELEKLRYQDAQGRWWMIGMQSGRWYYYENGRWLIGSPPQTTIATPAPEQPARVEPAKSASATPPGVASLPAQPKEKPRTEATQVQPRPTPPESKPASVETKPAAPFPPAKTMPPPQATSLGAERLRDSSDKASVTAHLPRSGPNPRIVIGGAALLGLVVVIILLVLAEMLVPSKPISSFIARTLGGAATATPLRPTPTVGPGASVSNLVGLGDKLFADGQIDPAIAQFQAAVKLDPNDAQTQIRLANAYALVGRLAEANAAANKAVQIEPNNSRAHAQLARALSWSGQSDAAISEAQKALSLDASNVPARAFLSEAYLRAGRFGDAQKEADAAVRADANSPEAHRANAWYFILAKSDDGTKEWNRVIELAPNLFFYHFEYGEVLRVYLNDPAKSVSEYQRATLLYPPYTPAYVSLGQAYLALNQPANAILQFQKAITYDPNSAEAYGYLGVGFKLQAKCSQAIPYFQRALELNGKFAPAANGLNECGVTNQAVPAPTSQGTPRPVAVPTAVVPATIVPLPPPSADASATKTSAQPGGAFPGQIAFSTYDGQYHLYLYTAQGGKKLLTELANTPMLSPEGTQILFQSWTVDRRGIHRMDLDGSADEQISLRSEDSDPSWSPDGTQYIYATRAGPGADVNARPFALRLGDPTSKMKQDPSSFIDKAQAPAWSSQGRIVFRDCGFPTDTCGLAVVDSDGSNKKALTTVNSAAPAWSPDSTKVVFMSDADRGNWDIWMVPSSGGSPQRLTDDPAEDGLPVWSPDGRFIAFVSKRGGTWSLWMMNADGTDQRKMIDLGGDPFGTVKGNPPGLPGQTWIEQHISWSK